MYYDIELTDTQIKKCNWPTARRYWMLYRGPGFLAVVYCDCMPHPAPFHQLARPATYKKTGKKKQLAHGIREGGGGLRSSPIMRPQESLVLCKSFTTLCPRFTTCVIEQNIKSWLCSVEFDTGVYGLHLHSCTHWMKPHNPPPPPKHLGSYTRAL